MGGGPGNSGYSAGLCMLFSGLSAQCIGTALICTWAPSVLFNTIFGCISIGSMFLFRARLVGWVIVYDCRGWLGGCMNVGVCGAGHHAVLGLWIDG